MWPNADKPTRQKMARMSASAAWGRHQWDAMAKYTNLLPLESQDGAFYRAVLCVQKEQWTEAQELIDLARSKLDTEVNGFEGFHFWSWKSYFWMFN